MSVDALEPVGLLYRDLRSGQRGLTQREAQRRLAVQGPNDITRKDARRPLQEFIGQLVHPLAVLLWVAAALALVSRNELLAAAIVIVILINAAFAFTQERHTEQAVELLQRLLPQHAKVVRDGQNAVIEATELVPGDLMVVEEGDRICADARLVDGDLEVNMSSLTGESMPVLRSATTQEHAATLLESHTFVFSGTTCTEGTARALVVRTGMSTELGRIAAMTQRGKRRPSPLELQVRRVAKLIALVAVIAGAAFIPLGIWLAGLSLNQSLTFAIGLIVANVPEGLLPTITLALAVGVRDLARRGALVKRLSAVETLGSTSTICTDKTGTITRNEMRVTEFWVPSLDAEDTADLESATHLTEPIRLALADVMRLCNTSDLRSDGSLRGDPTEVALRQAAGVLQPSDAEPTGAWTRSTLFHFDPGLRRMTTVDGDGSRLVAHVKGAPEALLPRCTSTQTEWGGDAPLDDHLREQCQRAISNLADRGLRVVCLADRPVSAEPGSRDDVERDLRLIGLAAMQDPARDEVPRAVVECHDAGMNVIMITGDHPKTATRIAHDVGIAQGNDAVNASEFDDLSEAELDRLLERRGEIILARSSPETKVRITDALREQGQVVAMTGDGVNDAPALRRADIGIAMGQRGTDVAREAATVVLTDDNFATIVSAVSEGRRVYANVRKFIVYIFAHATPEIVPYLVFALTAGAVPLPLTVAQILAIDIGTETLPALALGRERAEPDSMRQPPRPKSEPIITPSMLVRAWLLLGGVSAALAMGAFWITLSAAGWHPGYDTGPGSPLHHAYLQATTMTFLTIVSCQIGVAFAVRSERESTLRVRGPLGVFSNSWLLWGIAFEIVFAAAIVTLPGVSTALGMQAPPLWALALLPVCPPVVWGTDELARWVKRRRTSAE